MASARIGYNRNSELGGKIARAVGNIVSARKDLQELARILDKYLDDESAIAGDSGIALGQVSLVRNLVTQAAAELGGLATAQVGVGAATGSRQLSDAMG